MAKLSYALQHPSGFLFFKLNPWAIVGGTAMSACAEDEFIRPVNAVPGDIIVLTKPLGTQVAVNLNEWRQLESKTTWNKALGKIYLKLYSEAKYRSHI